MAITLGEALRHPSLAAADPLVHTGQDRLDRLVRWVHSSEIPDIAGLLRGGELLLTGGFVLASTEPDDQRRYLRRLAGRRVAALAVETGLRLPALPAALLEEARRLRFPVVELRRVVPFVAVTEALNSLLVNESVLRLRHADALSHALSAELARGGGPQELLAVLARLVPADVALADDTGDVMVPGGQGHATDFNALADTHSLPVTVHGVTAGRLLVRPHGGADQALLDAVLDRAPEAFGLAMLRMRPPSPRDRAVRELMRALWAPDATPQMAERAARDAGLSGQDGHVGVVAAGPGAVLGAVEAALRVRARRVLSGVEDGQLRAVVALPAPAQQERALLVGELRSASWRDQVHLAVGPLTRDLDRLPRTVAEAVRCLSLADEMDQVEPVVDAEELSLERLADRTAAREEFDAFVVEELGELLRLEPGTARRLVETLEMYFRCGCGKTETARRLHLQRQSLYQRLERIFTALGGDPTGTFRAAPLHLAARLYRAGFGRERSQDR